MKIAVLCASGKAGRAITEEALNKKYNVTAFVRDATKISDLSDKLSIIQKDIFALNSNDLKGFDILIDAFGEWNELSLHKKHIQHLSDILENTTKLLVVGGAGSLYMDKNHTTKFMDTKDFPKEYLGVARATAEVLDFLRTKKEINWVYVSPPALFIPDLQRSGKYEITGEEFKTNSQNESKISYADYASAMLDIAFNHHFKQVRVSVIGL